MSYYYFPIEGDIEVLTKEQSIIKMDTICEQWEDEERVEGQLFLGVFDWAFKDDPFELLIPQLIEGGSIPKNEKASSFFKCDIYGDCFLKADTTKIEIIETLIKHI